MNGIIDFIATICPITGNDLVDAILFAIITAAAFAVAWKLTSFISRDSETMSFVHWLIRIATFLILLSIALGIINLIRWVGSWPRWVYLVIGIVFAHVLAAVIVISIIRKNKKAQKEFFKESVNNKHE